MDITWENIFKIAAAFFASVGGATVVIIGVSKWFGDFLSQKLLANSTQKHEKDLEDIKSKYTKELEETKNELSKTRTLFVRYSEKQFGSYNNLWKVLLQTKRQAETLWNDPTPEKLKTFAEQIRLTRQAIEDEQLLIEDGHLDQLNDLLYEFENFEFGKTNLLTIFNTEDSTKMPTQTKITASIKGNTVVKDKYEKLLVKIGENFRKQLKG